MAKAQKNQIYVLKIHSGYLAKHNWHLNFKLSEIRKQPQIVVSLGSSQVLRWLTKLQNREKDDERATEIKEDIKIINNIHDLIFNSNPAKSSHLERAIKYVKSNWDDLLTFLEDGHIELTNNIAERAVKPFVIQRKRNAGRHF